MAINMADAEISGVGIPAIKTKSIILETTTIGSTSKSEEFDKNPHIDPVSSLKGMLQNTNHFVDQQTNKLTKSKLKVTLNVVLKDVLSSGGSGIPWFLNDMVVKTYRVLFVQSTNPVASSALLNEDLYFEAPKLFDPVSIVDGMKSTTKNLIDIIGCNKDGISKRTIKQIMPDGRVLYKITAAIEFKVDVYSPQHLSFFMVPYIDLSEEASLLGKGTLTTTYNTAVEMDANLIGKPEAEIIIENGTIAKNALLFYDESVANNAYTGPVHFVQPKSSTTPGYWAKGYSSSDPNFYYVGAEIKGGTKLKAVKATNTKIQDFRLLNRINKIDLNFTPLKAIASMFNESGQNITSPIINEAYFSDIKLSRDSKGRARFLFGFDWRKIVRDNSAFKNLYIFAKPEMIEKMLAESFLSSMKIKRRRIKETYCENGLIDSCSDHVDFEDHNEVDEIIAVGHEIETSGVTKNQFQGINGYSKIISRYKYGGKNKIKTKKMGSLNEITLNTLQAGIYEGGALSEIRHFVGVDDSIATETDGVYQYIVEIKMRDGATSVLWKLSKKASIVLGKLKLYLQDASIISDPYTNLFSSPFPANKAPAHKNAVKQALDVINEILSLTTRKPNIDDMLLALYLASNPNSGSPGGIEVLIQVVGTLKNKIISLLQSVSRSKKYMKNLPESVSHPAKIGKGQGTTYLQETKIEYAFSNVFDADIDRRAGYEFLSSQGKPFQHEGSGFGTNGLLSMTEPQFRARTFIEMQRMFNDSAIKTGAKISFTGVPAGDTIETSRYMFLAPSHTILPNMSQPYENIVTDAKVHEASMMSCAKLLADIITYNKYGRPLKDRAIPVNPNLPKFSEEDQRLRRKLSKVLFSRSCTIEMPMSLTEAKLLQGANVAVTNTTLAGNAEDVTPYSGLFGIDENQPTKTQMFNTPKDVLAEPPSTKMLDPEYKDTVNSNSLLLTLMNIKYLKSHEKHASKTWFDLDSSENAIVQINKDAMANPSLTSSENLAAATFSKIFTSPNHVKFWFLQSTSALGTGVGTGGDAITRYRWDHDVLKDQRWRPMIWMSFKNLVQIQVFKGYKSVTVNIPYPDVVSETTLSLKAERWQPLTTAGIKTDGTYLCRLIPYEDSMFNIEKIEDLQLPVYHEYFLINVGAAAAATKKIKGLNSKRVDTVIRAVDGTISATPFQEDSISGLVGKTRNSISSKNLLFEQIGANRKRLVNPLNPLKVSKKLNQGSQGSNKETDFIQEGGSKTPYFSS